jgi:hypothetical protein
VDGRGHHKCKLATRVAASSLHYHHQPREAGQSIGYQLAFVMTPLLGPSSRSTRCAWTCFSWRPGLMHVSTPAGARLTIRLAGRAGAIRLVRVKPKFSTINPIK